MKRREVYQECGEKILALCQGEGDVIVKMASVAAILHGAFEDFSWTGFYRVLDGQLVIGPYQGPVGCLRIAFGKGVCGTAASAGETQVVPDVHEFPGHIACDPLSRSEIVVPVWNDSGELIAVLDIDSTTKGTFDEVDQAALENLLASVFGAPAEG